MRTRRATATVLKLSNFFFTIPPFAHRACAHRWAKTEELTSMPQSKIENAILIIFAVPVLGVLLGSVYSIPAMKITNERDPWLTLLLVLGLGCTVFGIGALGGTPFVWSLAVFVLGGILALLARWLHGSLGHNIERFGMVHMLVLMLALGLAAVAHHKKEEPNKPAHTTAGSVQI